MDFDSSDFNSWINFYLVTAAFYLFFPFSDEVRQYVDIKRECDSENIRRLLRKLLDLCSVFNHFVDVVLHIQTINAQDVSS